MSELGNDFALAHWRRRVRLVVLLYSARRAGLVPIRGAHLHMLAYLANVLSPAWELRPLDGKVLKVATGAFYPGLQQDLDGLVGSGLVYARDVSHELGPDRIWRLKASYELNTERAARVVDALMSFDDEREVVTFVSELALALSAFVDDELDRGAAEDATYGDPIFGLGSVVDFGEWRDRNASASAATHLEALLASGASASLGERIHFYVHHLHSRIRAAHA